MATALTQLAQLRSSLAELRQSHGTAAPFVQQARSHSSMLEALPEKYRLVYHDLLNRLESSALFAEESCSFSQRDLLDHLQRWADKAEAYLATHSAT